MQQIADWLKKLGMSEYAQRFADNDIDIAVLRHLTDQDLKELGLSLGHRRKMLAAIAELGSTPPATAQSAAETEPNAQDAAERRQLTVMFCDLVGSTALSARLDAEDLRSIIGRYHRCCTELVEGNGGFVAKYMGDGVLAYFGYPQAHEHDAERSVRAGLGLIDAVPKLAADASSPLQVRIGIATGLVVVGDLIGSGEAQERGIVGETPNLAARLQGIAEPNMVIIADSTRRLVGNFFELQDLGPKDLKGIAGPARAWAALRASSVESRFEALHAAPLTALVGREEEMELLLRRWRRAKSGEGQVLLLSAEPGVGKSRLVAAMRERLQGEPHTEMRCFCSPHQRDSSLFAVINSLERMAGFKRDEITESKLKKLDALLDKSSPPMEDLPFLTGSA
jgi:class 3 adenylate cyclase